MAARQKTSQTPLRLVKSEPVEAAVAKTAQAELLTFDAVFESALGANRHIGKLLEKVWSANTNDAFECLRLSAFALMVHDDPYAEHFEAKPWAIRLGAAISACQAEFAGNEALAFWRDAGTLASQQSSGRASQEIFDACIERVRKGAAPGPNEWLLIAVVCIAEANSRMQFATACAIAEMTHANELYKLASVVVEVRWKYLTGYSYFLAQDYAQAIVIWKNCKAQITEIQKDTSSIFHPGDSLNSLIVELAVGIARVEIEANEVASGLAELKSIQNLTNSAISITRVSYHHMMSRGMLRQGKSLEALHHLEIAREILRLEFQDPGYWPVVLSEYLQVLFALNRWDEAVRAADDFAPYFVRHGQPYGEFLRQVALTRMWAESPSGDCEIPFVTSLKTAFDLAVKHDFRSFVRSVPEFAAWLCAKALENNVHAEFVREVISSRKLPIPSRAPKQWPWAVWLNLIGPFGITLDGQPLALTGKVAQKPLELIKLLACTKRYTLSLDFAAMQLWPETEEFTAARKNLETTISRARKLIGDAAIKVADGRVQLDASLVGSDLQYVLDTCTEAEALAHRGASLPQLNRATEQLSNLYEGELLQAEEDMPWLNTARQHLRNAFVRATLALAGALTLHQSQTEEITRLLETAISREPLAEQLYARLMQHYAALGRKAEALHTFRRCRQSLSVIAGLNPSRETETLKEQLLL